jgi:hypothetical protein
VSATQDFVTPGAGSVPPKKDVLQVPAPVTTLSTQRESAP